jgi:uncharacterized protein (DUF952 family)
MPEERIVHLCSGEDWQAAQQAGEYRAASLEEEGFIHCSRPDQILEVSNRYYQGVQGLVLLWIDPRRVQAQIRLDAAEGQLYPHIYGALNLEAVTAVTNFTPDNDGIFRSLP